MSKVFLLNNGMSYSDYSVEAIFANRKAAETARARTRGEIEEYTLYDEDPGSTRIFAIEYDGRVRGLGLREWTFNIEKWDGPHFEGRVVRGIGIGHYERDFYRYWGEDEDAVRKAFSDYHGQQGAVRSGIA